MRKRYIIVNILVIILEPYLVWYIPNSNFFQQMSVFDLDEQKFLGSSAMA